MRARFALWASTASAAVLLTPSPARAWLFEEHANIGRYAAVHLDVADAETFDSLWATARGATPGATESLCRTGRTSPTHDRSWACVDFGALPAAGGDHSCTPEDLWQTVTAAPWFREVYALTATTERLLHKRDVSDSQKVDIWHQGNIDLQRADPSYADRAAKNNVHFVLARTWDDDDSIERFVDRASGPGEPPNATQAYAMYHLAALAAAAKLRAIPPSRADYAREAAVVLATESFALHFLEDSFAAGHFVGLLSDPGSIAQRPGTHDYYCEHGLEGRTWRGAISYGAHGDAFQTDECLAPTASTTPAPPTRVDERGVVVCDERAETLEGKRRSDLVMAGAAVHASLTQVLRVLRGEALGSPFDLEGDRVLSENVCTSVAVGARVSSVVRAGASLVADVLALTPEPYRADPALPHFRGEIGFFLGGTAAARGAAAFDGGLDPGANVYQPRFQGAISVGVGGGIGIEGVTTQATDGVFAGGFELISYGADQFVCQGCTTPPTRFGWGFRLHLPFFVVPGDAIVSIPLYLFGHDTMAIEAAQGGLLRLERINRANGFTWQLVALREAAFYSSREGAFQMSELEAPLLELRSKHEYSERVGGDASVQIGATVERNTLDYGTPHEVHDWAWTAFVRFSLDGIYYLWP